MSQGSVRSSTAANREEPALQGSFGVLHIPVLILAARGKGGGVGEAGRRGPWWWVVGGWDKRVVGEVCGGGGGFNPFGRCI